MKTFVTYVRVCFINGENCLEIKNFSNHAEKDEFFSKNDYKLVALSEVCGLIEYSVDDIEIRKDLTQTIERKDNEYL